MSDTNSPRGPDTAALRALADAATPGPWTCERPGVDEESGFADGVIVAATAPGQGIFASAPHGSFPANDRRFIVAARSAVPALCDEVDRLRAENETLRRALLHSRHVLVSVANKCAHDAAGRAGCGRCVEERSAIADCKAALKETE